MGRKIYKLKTFKEFPAFNNADYHGCTFYLDSQNAPEIYDVCFRNCSFRTDVFVQTHEDCDFYNCNFSRRLHILHFIMPHGVLDKITHLTKKKHSMRRLPDGYCKLTNLEHINIANTFVDIIPSEFLLLKKLKVIVARTGVSFDAKKKSYARGTSSYLYFCYQGVNYYRKVNRSFYGHRVLIELGSLEQDPVDPEMVDC